MQVSPDFQKIVEGLTLLVARPSSVQRDMFYCQHFLNNKYKNIKNVLILPVSNTDAEWFLGKEDLDVFFANQEKEFWEVGFIDKYKAYAEATYSAYIKICQEVQEAVLSGDRPQIISAIHNYYKYSTQKDTFLYFALNVYPFEQITVPKYQEILKEKFDNQYERIWNILTSQSELTGEQELRIALSEAKQENLQGENLRNKLQEITNKFRFIGIYCPEDRGLDLVTTQERFEMIKPTEAEEIKALVAKNRKEYLELIQTIDDPKIKEICQQVNFNVYFRTIRMERFSIGFSFLTSLYDLIEKETGLTRKEVGNLTNEEIVSYFSKNVLPPKRPGILGMLYSQESNRVLLKEEIDFAHEYFKPKAEGPIEIKGQIAQKGKVSGIAKIILSAEDLGKVEDGDVLVSNFTRPEYMAAINKAVAIVTNDGGITCHAAIVSRELKKPCIIATKVATKLLKDGDLVEVDADKGIVRIIK